MAIFRFHRGGLLESLATSAIVKNKIELIDTVQKGFFDHPKIFDLKIEKYGKGFDYRIGWYTYIVTIKESENDIFHVCGFLSEDL